MIYTMNMIDFITYFAYLASWVKRAVLKKLKTMEPQRRQERQENLSFHLAEEHKAACLILFPVHCFRRNKSLRTWRLERSGR